MNITTTIKNIDNSNITTINTSFVGRKRDAAEASLSGSNDDDDDEEEQQQIRDHDGDSSNKRPSPSSRSRQYIVRRNGRALNVGIASFESFALLCESDDVLIQIASYLPRFTDQTNLRITCRAMHTALAKASREFFAEFMQLVSERRFFKAAELICSDRRACIAYFSTKESFKAFSHQYMRGEHVNATADDAERERGFVELLIALHNWSPHRRVWCEIARCLADTPPYGVGIKWTMPAIYHFAGGLHWPTLFEAFGYLNAKNQRSMFGSYLGYMGDPRERPMERCVLRLLGSVHAPSYPIEPQSGRVVISSPSNFVLRPGDPVPNATLAERHREVCRLLGALLEMYKLDSGSIEEAWIGRETNSVENFSSFRTYLTAMYYGADDDDFGMLHNGHQAATRMHILNNSRGQMIERTKQLNEMIANLDRAVGKAHKMLAMHTNATAGLDALTAIAKRQRTETHVAPAQELAVVNDAVELLRNFVGNGRAVAKARVDQLKVIRDTHETERHRLQEGVSCTPLARSALLPNRTPPPPRERPVRLLSARQILDVAFHGGAGLGVRVRRPALLSLLGESLRQHARQRADRLPCLRPGPYGADVSCPPCGRIHGA